MDYDSFRASEMIEQEDLPLLDIAVGVVKFDIHAKTLSDCVQSLGILQNYVSLMVPKFGKQTVKGEFPLSTYKLKIYRC